MPVSEAEPCFLAMIDGRAAVQIARTYQQFNNCEESGRSWAAFCR